MRSTGIIRRVDELGRIVIPKEMRTKMDIAEDTPMEIHIEGDTIVMKKDVPNCVFCGSGEDVTEFRSKKVCCACMRAIKES